jgi:general secretion pathway protein G
MKNKKGFTLIELLVVIAIIGIIASMVLIGLNSTRRLGRDARRISDVSQMRTAAEIYFNGCGVYPGGTYTGANPNCNAADPYAMAAIAGWGITQMPSDPSTGAPYVYCGTDTTYTIQTTLEDPNNSVFNQAPPANPCGGLACTTPNYCVAN